MKKIPDNNVGKALGYLERNDITDRRVPKEKGNKPGRRRDLWWLIRDPETLYKIFNLIKNSKLKKTNHESDILYEIFKSEFCQELITKELVDKLNDFARFESSWLDEDDKFTNSELELILTIIKLSPTALYTVLIYIYEADDFYSSLELEDIGGQIKGLLIFNLLNDLKMRPPNNYVIDYKIEINLHDKSINDDVGINKKEYTDYSDGLITHIVRSIPYTLIEKRKGIIKKLTMDELKEAKDFKRSVLDSKNKIITS